MIRYIIRRLLYLIPLFFGILVIVFVASRIAGDPIELMLFQYPHLTDEALQNLRVYFGLDQPLHIQFFTFIGQLFQGNLGNSYAIGGGLPVTTLIGRRALWTLLLQLVALVLSLIIAIPIGIISAKKQYSKLDVSVTTTSLFGTCVPIFYMGIIAIIIFSYYLGWFPYGGVESINPERYPFGSSILDNLWHLVLPTAVLTFAILAPVVLLVRSSMLEVLRQDYILAARASGLCERTVVYKHALRNALIPVVTYVGLFFGGILAGAPITEKVFNWPGVGRLFIDALEKLDFPVIMGVTFFITIMTLFVNLIIDLTYGYLDPRIRLE